MGNKKIVDRRKNKRFQTEKNTYAVLRAKGSKLGRVIDISKGGLAFRYVSVGQRLKGPLELDLLSHQYDYRIDKIPVRIITDLELANKKAFKSTTLKRVGVQFGKLTREQKSKLEHFIRDYTLEEASRRHVETSRPEEVDSDEKQEE
jgi:c-di-GMP-binding flagellar brake protein YcgR